MKEIFNDTECGDEPILRNTSTRIFETKSRELSLIINEIENLMSNVIAYKSNFIQEEYPVLQSLKGNQDIVFKRADKGDGWVIMDKNYYQNKIVMVACRVQIWKKKHFVKIVTSLLTVLFKMTLYLCIYFVFTKKPHYFKPL